MIDLKAIRERCKRWNSGEKFKIHGTLTAVADVESLLSLVDEQRAATEHMHDEMDAARDGETIALLKVDEQQKRIQELEAEQDAFYKAICKYCSVEQVLKITGDVISGRGTGEKA